MDVDFHLVWIVCVIFERMFLELVKLPSFSVPLPKEVKYLVRTLQNKSLSNALETLPTDYERQIKMTIDFCTMNFKIVLFDYTHQHYP